MPDRLLHLAIAILTAAVLLGAPPVGSEGGGVSPTLQVDPPALHFTTAPGTSKTHILRLANPSAESVAWTLSERSNGPALSLATAPNDDSLSGDGSDVANGDALEILATVDWSRPHAPDRLIVGFRPGSAATAPARRMAHRAAGGEPVRGFRLIPAEVVRVPPGRSLEETAARYARRPDVEYVSPSYTLRHCAIPDDARFGEQWNLDNHGSSRGGIAAPLAWNISSAAEDVIIAILDTGIDLTHPDLRDNLWINQAEAQGAANVDDDGNGIVDDIHGARWTNGDGTVTNGNPQDGHGHGTHVAGIAGAVGNNGIGVAGVAWRVQIMALKMLKDSGDGQDIDAVAAIEYAVENGARVINASWGTPYRVPALQQAIDAARRAGVLFVTAAGNGNANIDVVDYYPANYNVASIITVANSTSTDSRYPTSNYGPTRVHLAAPGAGILSCQLDGEYGLLTGTSMSSPHVAGVAALLLNLAPEATIEECKAWLLDGADPALAWSGLTVTGGRLNAAGSLAFVHVPWLQESHRAGVLAPGASVDIAITALAPGADMADQTPWAARLIVAETESGQRTDIPITLEAKDAQAAGYWLMTSASDR